MQNEKRKFSRIRLEFILTLTLNDGSVHHVEKFEDISIGGCLVPTKKEYQDNTTCTVTINLGDSIANDSPKIEAKGHITRHNDEKTAIQFTAIDPESLFHLQNIIRYNAPDPDRIDDEIQQTKGLK